VSSKAEGAGMGLYISKRLATLYYDGDITLKNNQPTGCIATVTLVKGSTNE
jgi:signal transduction histidine kinase